MTPLEIPESRPEFLEIQPQNPMELLFKSLKSLKFLKSGLKSLKSLKSDLNSLFHKPQKSTWPLDETFAALRSASRGKMEQEKYKIHAFISAVYSLSKTSSSWIFRT